MSRPVRGRGSFGSPLHVNPLERRSPYMKGRLFACLLLASSVFVIPALAQQGGGGGGGPSPGQQPDDRRGKQGGQSTEDINSALQDYEQRMSRNLDQCRHELDQMK